MEVKSGKIREWMTGTFVGIRRSKIILLGSVILLYAGSKWIQMI